MIYNEWRYRTHEVSGFHMLHRQFQRARLWQIMDCVIYYSLVWSVLCITHIFPSCVFGKVFIGLFFDVWLLQVSLQETLLCSVNHWWLLRHSGKWLGYWLCPNHWVNSTVRRVPICTDLQIIFVPLYQSVVPLSIALLIRFHFAGLKALSVFILYLI